MSGGVFYHCNEWISKLCVYEMSVYSIYNMLPAIDLASDRSSSY